MRFHSFVLLYFVCLPPFLMTALILQGTDDISLAQICWVMFCRSSQMITAVLCWRGLLLYLQLENTLEKLESSQGTCLAGHCFHSFLLKKRMCDFCNMLVIIVVLENSSPAKLLETEAHLVIQYLSLQTCIHCAIYKCLLPSTFCTHLSCRHIQ